MAEVDESLIRLADAAGLLPQWTDAHGAAHQVSPATLRAVLAALGFPANNRAQIRDSLSRASQPGSRSNYQPGPQSIHETRLIVTDTAQPAQLHPPLPPGAAFQLTDEQGRVRDGQLDQHGCLPLLTVPGFYQVEAGEQRLQVAVAPVGPPQAARGCRWGLIAQCYSLRRADDGGLGDIGALADLAVSAAHHGADALLSSPLHACDPDTRECSPYSPSDRRLFNLFHAAPDRVLGHEAMRSALQAAGCADTWERLQAQQLIDWPTARQVRLALLRQLYAGFLHSQHPRRQAFIDYCRNASPALRQFSCFQALRESLTPRTGNPDWRHWPANLRHPGSDAVQRFQKRYAAQGDFHMFCQWLAEESLAQLHRRSSEAGMGIGLMTDLAVGSDPGGCQAWAEQDHFLNGLTIGAPPDLLNTDGQNWGLTTFSPAGLQADGYRGFLDMLHACLRHAGGLRIDHVMGLARLWVIPAGASPRDGVYLRYPAADLIRLLALAAHRNQALIVGEDLGTVPDGLREQMARHGILGTRVLMFEQERGRLPPDSCWDEPVLATTTTHDLPTTLGWFRSRDIEWRYQAGQSSIYQAQQASAQRQHEATRLQRALNAGQPTLPDQQAGLDGALRYLGRSQAPLVLIPLEDVMGELEQPNLPGGGALHPNWRRRWHHNAEALLAEPAASQRLATLRDARADAATRRPQNPFRNSTQDPAQNPPPKKTPPP
ncbi:4-alpha-glucanotransferase [Alcanivorax quisquiliarum]|uniref:4-alpha-glucanotransferase n=1 Tax=Alcanivorax quisquiliarum TaxID=2933565 RepID=A0ABT0E986_9GAMM|nr:4-alpha-glucanotransferase [Alcanivorax quisquiliarum]MCK0538400.1 4-alpha-glucanotransferase [Alcanivorax quisquiliarum]